MLTTTIVTSYNPPSSATGKPSSKTTTPDDFYGPAHICVQVENLKCSSFKNNKGSFRSQPNAVKGNDQMLIQIIHSLAYTVWVGLSVYFNRYLLL